jgi:hypothetical protein
MTELSLDECIEIVIRALTDEGPVFDASLFETANVGPYEGANVAPEDSIQIDRAKAFAMWADGLPIYYLHNKLSAVVFKPCPVLCVLLQSGLPSGRLAIVGANITSSVRAVRVNMTSPGGGGSLDGSGRAVAAQPGCGCEKGYRGRSTPHSRRWSQESYGGGGKKFSFILLSP